MPYNLIDTAQSAIPIVIVSGGDALAIWLAEQPDRIGNWVVATGFEANSGSSCLIANEAGNLQLVLCGIDDNDIANLWMWAALHNGMPEGDYMLDACLDDKEATQAALGWALAGYRFERYSSNKIGKYGPSLLWPEACDREHVIRTAHAIFLVRNLINTPANDMGPEQLASCAQTLAKDYNAQCSIIVGDDLLEANFPAIHAVGRASVNAPRLIDMRWGNDSNPKVTLVGKGVCFDTGGLDLKDTSGMKLMKKDMGGAAHVLGLASMIMAADLPVRLRVLVPAVENSISGNAMRPLDVITMRDGQSVEIGNTDAEGRLVLADALSAACEESPQMLIDVATLTGAARVALGTDLPALFCNNDTFAGDLEAQAKIQNDPMWRLPLWKPYEKMIEGKVADLNNAAEGGYGGAITAALFLQAFVAREVNWAHIDLMGWNTVSRPGRPEGGEAMSMRALFALLKERFG
jgi:leucyl aminopeptidase